jgi:predicted phosphodiesterase
MAPRMLAVVSDIHGNLPALEAVAADAGAVDGWLNLGDILSGPLWPAETADWLMAPGRAWPTIAGNHERQVLSLPLARQSAADRHTTARLGEHHRDWLRSLPTRLAIEPALLCVHGTPGSDLIYLLHSVGRDGLRDASAAEIEAHLALLPAPRPRWLLCGHSHLPRLVTAGTTTILNPGSVGLQAYDDDHPFEHVVETGDPRARYALLRHDGAQWHAELRAVAYDHEAAAVQAERNGRPDWADALRTGRVGRRERDLGSTAPSPPSPSAAARPSRSGR